MNLSTWVPEPWHGYLLTVIPDWSLETWVVFGLILLCAFLFEEAHYRQRVQDAEKQSIGKPKQTLLVPILAIFLVAVLWIGNIVARPSTKPVESTKAPALPIPAQENTGNSEKAGLTLPPARKSGDTHTPPASNSPITPLAPASGENSVPVGGVKTGDCSNVQIGGSSNQASVNCGPPPATFSFKEKVITPLAKNSEKFMEAHITTDRSIPGAIIGIVFSDPVEMSKEPSLKGAAIFQMNTGQLQSDHLLPNTLGVTINLPAAFLPGQELIIPVKSKADVHIIKVMQVAVTTP
jgi:hypothetical protein